MTTLNKIILHTLSAITLVYAASAYSDVPGYTELDNPTPWTHVASACAPDEGAIGKYSFNYGDFGFKSGVYSDVSSISTTAAAQVVLPISVRCNVTDPMDGSIKPAWNSLIVGYIDPDGTATGTRVIARLYKLARANGSASLIAYFDSNTLAQNVRAEALVATKEAFDFHNNEYFVQLDLYRANQTTYYPLAYSARLAYAYQPTTIK